MSEFSGYGATLAIYISSAYTAIAQIRDISGPSLSADTIEVSHRDSVFKKYAAGQVDSGEISFDLVYDPDVTTHKAQTAGGLAYALQNRTLESFRITFPDAATVTTATFSGYVTKFEPKEPMNDALTADVTIKVTGAITWA